MATRRNDNAHKKGDSIPKVINAAMAFPNLEPSTIGKMQFDESKIMATKTKIQTVSLDEIKNEFIGAVGTKKRDKYEYELNMEILSFMIKKARQEQNLTQEQLGQLVGVQKAQISKLESSANSATVDTILKVFKALKAEINFNVKIENRHLKLVQKKPKAQNQIQ